jgi:hypothetical protein
LAAFVALEVVVADDAPDDLPFAMSDATSDLNCVSLTALDC